MKQSGEKIVALTAYDVVSASLLNEAGCEIVLVGDSLGMVIQGHSTTLPVTIDDMIYHTRCVARANINSMIVADMPFLTYHTSIQDAVTNAGALIQKGSAEAVKLEGGADMAPVISRLVSAGIPVMGHIGLTPQDVLNVGGFFVQGVDKESASELMEDALTLQEAGVFALVLECIPAQLAEKISRQLTIPTIGIGAGCGCDGQVLVLHDMLGLFKRFKPKFVKTYASLYDDALKAVAQYRDEVKDGRFPAGDQSY
jgi:3-methyl-2-oxobutanoate hydroxymethyltransferase